MKTWKITLKDGTSFQANNYHHLAHLTDKYIISEKILLEGEEIIGYLWWKRTIPIQKEILHTIVVIPKENILKAELTEMIINNDHLR